MVSIASPQHGWNLHETPQLDRSSSSWSPMILSSSSLSTSSLRSPSHSSSRLPLLRSLGRSHQPSLVSLPARRSGRRCKRAWKPRRKHLPLRSEKLQSSSGKLLQARGIFSRPLLLKTGASREHMFASKNTNLAATEDLIWRRSLPSTNGPLRRPTLRAASRASETMPVILLCGRLPTRSASSKSSYSSYHALRGLQTMTCRRA